MASSTYLLHATAKYGTRSMDGIHRQQPVTCPVPGCGKTVGTTQSGFMVDHTNAYGYTCDGTNRTPVQAAQLQIDAQGRLIGVDKMQQEKEA